MERGLQPGSAAEATSKLVYIWVGGVATLILLVVAIVLVSDAVTKPNTNTVKTPGQMQKTRLQTAARTSNTMPPLAPLTWSDAEGAYMIQLYLGSGPVDLVLDTGSSQVSAKVDGCEWTQCVDDKCHVQACPCEGNDCTLEFYKPSSGGTPLNNAERQGYSAVMKYGSQEDTVSHVLDKVVIPHIVVSCSQLLQPKRNGSGGYRNALRLQGTQHRVSADMVVHQVHRIKGESTSNMFGLARPDVTQRGGDVAPVVLDKLFEATGGDTRCWSILLFPRTGWWALGPLPCFSHVQYMPLMNPSAFQQFVTKFYVIPIIRIEAGPTVELLRPVSPAQMPKYCVLDTGTTYTYGSHRLGSGLDKLGYDERTWYVRFSLGDKKTPVQLLFTPEQLKDPDFPDASVIQCTPGRTLDGYDDMFAGVNVLLWGAYMMRDMYWEFDVGRSMVGVQRVQP